MVCVTTDQRCMVNKPHLGKVTMKAQKRNFFDTKTGTLGSEAFDFLFRREVRRSARYRGFVTILILEPDRKPQASKTLRTLADLVKKDIRAIDLIARIGKARFAVLLLESDLHVAYMVASRIIDRVSGYVFPKEERQRVTLSIGGACFPTTSATTNPSDLFKEAEDALEAAKKTGNTIYFRDLHARKAHQGGGENRTNTRY